MPGLLSAIPGLSNLPNPLNIFNNDDAQPLSQSQSPSSPTTNTSNRQLPSSSSTNSMASNAQASNPNEGGASKFVSMLSRGLDVFTLNSNPTTPQKSAAQNANAESDDGSPTPMRPALRTAPDGSGSSGSSPSGSSPSRSGKAGVVIAETAADGDGPRSNTEGNRRRGLSSASRGSGGVVGPSRRNRRVETYVLVKPPPTSSKNPLNLQLQLVMPAKSGRPRGGSDAASKAMVPPMPTAAGTTTTTSATAVEDSSAPSTPARRSFETSPAVEKVASSGSDATTSTPSGSVTSDAPLSEASAAAGAPSLPTLPEDQATTKLRRRSSTASQTSTSTASMASSASGKQRIVPLYNLAVHNVVQPTTVTDAGTDSKVAKFLKRNLDINGVGILEPSEVWLPLYGGGGSIAGNSPRPSFDPNSGTRLARPSSMVSNMSLLSPAVTRDDTKRASVDAGGKPIKLDSHGLRVQDEGPKKFFGKIFRKRQAAAEPHEQQRRASISASRSSTFLAAEAAGNLKIPSTPPQGAAVHFNGAAELAQVGHPTFGLAPAMMARNSSATNLDMNGAIVGLTGEVPKPKGLESDAMNIVRSGRPVGYTWTVRRWAKKNTEGWASHIVAAAAAGLDMGANAIPGDGTDEVVFEWVKMRFSATTEEAIAALRRHPAAAEGADLLKRARPPGLPTPSPGASPAGSRVSLVSGQQSHLDAPATIKARKGPPPSSPAPSKRRVSPPTARSSDDAASADVNGNLDTDEHGVVPAVLEPDHTPPTPEDSGYDSDPEDSETPWACSVWVKRTGQRQLLATLTPAPHHPKVIAVLRIPSVLKGLSLTDLPTTVAKSTAQTGVAARVREEVCLTEENLKDVVSVTAMWLVAREEFSGFGRKEKRRA